MAGGVLSRLVPPLSERRTAAARREATHSETTYTCSAPTNRLIPNPDTVLVLVAILARTDVNLFLFCHALSPGSGSLSGPGLGSPATAVNRHRDTGAKFDLATAARGGTILAGTRGDSPPVGRQPPTQPWMIKETAPKWAATARTTRVCHTSW